MAGTADENEEVVAVPDAVGLFAAAAQGFLTATGFGVGFETVPSSEAGALVVLALAGPPPEPPPEVVVE